MVQEKGNIVQEYDMIVKGQTVHVRISDSAYAGKSEAELEEVRRYARQVSRNIALRYEARMRAQAAGKEGGP